MFFFCDTLSWLVLTLHSSIITHNHIKQMLLYKATHKSGTLCGEGCERICWHCWQHWCLTVKHPSISEPAERFNPSSESCVCPEASFQWHVQMSPLESIKDASWPDVQTTSTGWLLLIWRNTDTTLRVFWMTEWLSLLSLGDSLVTLQRSSFRLFLWPHSSGVYPHHDHRWGLDHK